MSLITSPGIYFCANIKLSCYARQILALLERSVTPDMFSPQDTDNIVTVLRACGLPRTRLQSRRAVIWELPPYDSDS